MHRYECRTRRATLHFCPTYLLFSPRVRKAYEEMGILGFTAVAAEALQREDERVAEEFDCHHGLRPEVLHG